MAATTATVTPGPWSLYRGTSIVTPRVDYPSQDACVEAAKALGVERAYTCRTSTAVTVTIVPDAPVATLTASPQTLSGSGSVRITWSCSKGSATISAQGQSMALAASGSLSVPITATTAIKLTCTDGTRQSSASTTVTVTSVTTPLPPVTGSASLKWDAVTQYTDGKPAMITGYRAEWGKGAFTQSKVVTDTQLVVGDLTQGTWQFRVVAISATGEGVSAMGTKTIP